LQAWIEQGEPVVMWLSGLHIPESYLTAMVQTTCRAKNWPLDKSTLYTVVTKYVDPASVSTANLCQRRITGVLC
jgi:dynein heavy chain